LLAPRGIFPQSKAGTAVSRAWKPSVCNNKLGKDPAFPSIFEIFMQTPCRIFLIIPKDIYLKSLSFLNSRGIPFISFYALARFLTVRNLKNPLPFILLLGRGERIG
jgi:hypothetical protein